MSQTRSQRIHRGFHRVGILLGALAMLIGALLAATVRYEASKATEVGIIAAAAAITVYVLSRALGWVLAGFTGDQ